MRLYNYGSTWSTVCISIFQSTYCAAFHLVAEENSLYCALTKWQQCIECRRPHSEISSLNCRKPPPPPPHLLNEGIFTVWLLIIDWCNGSGPFSCVLRILTPFCSWSSTGRCYWCNQFPGGTRRRPCGHPVPLRSAEEVKSAECTQACHESQRRQQPGGDAAPQTGWIKRQQVPCAACHFGNQFSKCSVMNTCGDL